MKTLVGVVGKGPERIAELAVGEEDEAALLQEYVSEVTFVFKFLRTFEGKVLHR